MGCISGKNAQACGGQEGRGEPGSPEASPFSRRSQDVASELKKLSQPFVGLQDRGDAQKCVRRLMQLADSGLIRRRQSFDRHTECERNADPFDVARVCGVKQDQAVALVRSIAQTIDTAIADTLKKAIDDNRAAAEAEGSILSLQDTVTAVERLAAGTHVAVRAGVTLLGHLSGTLPAPGPASVVYSTVPGQNFYVEGLCRCVGVLNNTVVNPGAGFASAKSLEDGVTAILRIFRALGAAEVDPDEGNLDDALKRLPYYCLDAAAKKLLLFICGARQQQIRMMLAPIRRHSVLEDARLAARSRIARASDPEVRHTFSVFPTAALRATARALRDGSAAGSDDVGTAAFIFPSFESDEGGVLEAGEGHGPRKEFFDLCAAALTHDWTPSLDLSSTAEASVTEGSPYCEVVINQNSPVTFHSGSRILIRGLPLVPGVDASGTLTQEIVSSEPQHSGAPVGRRRVRLRLAQPSPATRAAAPFSIQMTASPLFRVDGTHAWFNGALATTGEGIFSPQERDTLDHYAFAGWLAAHAITNGCTMQLGLPTVFYEMLACWPDWTPTEDHLRSIGEEQARNLSEVRRMKDSVFRTFLESMGHPEGLTREGYVQQHVKEALSESIAPQMTAFVWGFGASGLLRSPPALAVSPAEMQCIVQGRMDDGVCDFDIRVEYRCVLAPELRTHPHNEVMMGIFWRLVDEGFGAAGPEQRAPRKRALLKFLTGRSLLPAQRNQEMLRVDTPLSLLNARDCDEAVHRLPVSHTCDNTLELPSYLEALLFCSSSPWYQSAGRRVGDFITESDRDRAWHSIDAATRADLERRVTSILLDRLSVAVFSTDTYELDDIDGSTVQASPGYASVIPVGVTEGPSEVRDVNRSTASSGSAGMDPPFYAPAVREPLPRPGSPPSSDSLVHPAADTSSPTRPPWPVPQPQVVDAAPATEQVLSVCDSRRSSVDKEGSAVGSAKAPRRQSVDECVDITSDSGTAGRRRSADIGSFNRGESFSGPRQPVDRADWDEPDSPIQQQQAASGSLRSRNQGLFGAAPVATHAPKPVRIGFLRNDDDVPQKPVVTHFANITQDKPDGEPLANPQAAATAGEADPWDTEDLDALLHTLQKTDL